MFLETFQYPFRGSRGDVLETLAIGGGLHLLSVFVPGLPLVPVVGYLVRVLEVAGNEEERKPPTFHNLRTLLRRGLGGTVVTCAYLLVPVVVLILTFGGILGTDLDPAATVGAGVYVAGTATLVVAVGFAYPLPAALTAYARTGRLRTAFSPSHVLPAVQRAQYFVGWTFGMAVLGVAAGFAPPLNRAALGFFLLFYAEVVAATAWARAVAGPQ